MSQDEVLDFLKRNPGWVSASVISHSMKNISTSAIRNTLLKLHDYGDVERIIVRVRAGRGASTFIYRIKREKNDG